MLKPIYSTFRLRNVLRQIPLHCSLIAGDMQQKAQLSQRGRAALRVVS